MTEKKESPDDWNSRLSDCATANAIYTVFSDGIFEILIIIVI